MATHQWDAQTYDRIADPQTRWGATVLDRLELRGDERVLDAACGTGRVSEQLLERIPRGKLVALDGDAAMIAEARGRLARFGEQVEFVVADLLDPLPIGGGPVDAGFSTAAFHWIKDHDRLFANLALASGLAGSSWLNSVARATSRRCSGPFALPATTGRVRGVTPPSS